MEAGGEARSGTMTSGEVEPTVLLVAAVWLVSPPASGAEPVCCAVAWAVGRYPEGGLRGSPAPDDSQGRCPGSHSAEDLGCFPPLKSLQQKEGKVGMLQAKVAPYQ